jgi:hypothetical protein
MSKESVIFLKETKKVLQSLGRSIGDNFDLKLVYGNGIFTDFEIISINPDLIEKRAEELGSDLISENHKYLLLLGQNYHEAAHNRYTDPDSIKTITTMFNTRTRKRVAKDILNILEDSRIELALANQFPGTKDILKFNNKISTIKRPNIEDVDNDLSRFIEVLMQLAIVGKTKGEIDPKINQYINRDWIKKARYGETTKVAFDITLKYMTKIEPLLEKQEAEMEKYKSLIEDLVKGNRKMKAEKADFEKEELHDEEDKSSQQGSGQSGSEDGKKEEDSDSKDDSSGKESMPMGSSEESDAKPEDGSASSDSSQSQSQDGESKKGSSSGSSNEDKEDEEKDKSSSSSGRSSGSQDDKDDKEDEDKESSSGSSNSKDDSKEEKETSKTGKGKGGSDQHSKNDSLEELNEEFSDLLKEGEEKIKELKQEAKKRKKQEKEEEQKKKTERKDIEETADAVKKIEIHEGVGLESMKFESTPNGKSNYIQAYKLVEPYIRRTTKAIQRVLNYRKSREKIRGRKRGKLDGKNLHKTGFGDKKVFYKKNINEPDVAIHLLIDQSGSMRNPDERDNNFSRMDRARQAAVLFRHVLKKLEIPHAIWGFSAYFKATRVNSWEYVNFSNWDKADDERLGEITAYQDNRDGYNIRVASEELKKQPQEKKILIVISDGQPHHSRRQRPYTGSRGMEDTKKAINECKKLNVTPIGMSIGSRHDFVGKLYKNHIKVQHLEELNKKISRELKRHILG